MKKEMKNKIVIWFYFLSAFFILNYGKLSIPNHALGIALIIAGSYGIICIHKKAKFLF